MGGRARIATWPAAMLVWALAQATAAAQSAGSQNLEYPVKANFLVRFAAFTEWPQAAFADARSPLTICVVGRDPFGAALDDAARGQTAHGRPIVIRRLETADRGCHIAYFGRAGAEAAALGAAPILTVTDENAGPARGVIHFVVADRRVRFHADQAAATRFGLRVDSRLLRLALSVRTAAP